MSRIRTAVIGAGHLGRIHTRLAKTIDSCSLVAVADPTAEAREQIAREFQVETVPDYERLIGKIDAAIVAAPTKLHHRIARRLLEAGVHCLVEKPVTATTAEADELVRLADANRLVLQVGHVERFNPALEIADTHLGQPRYIEASRTSGYTFRSTDVGVVLDLMIHDIDIVLAMVRSELVDVRAIGSAVFGGFEDIAQARLEFADGCVANLSASRASYVAQRTIQVFADNGFASLDLANHSATLVQPSAEFAGGQIDFHGLSPEQQQQIKESLFTEILPKSELKVPAKNAILEEQHDFAQSILEGRTPRVSGADGRAALRVAELILESVDERQARGPEPQSRRTRPTLLHPHAFSGSDAERARRKAG